jgi:hypothetical protein
MGQWAEIAKEHLAGAERARADLIEQQANGEPLEAMARELRESMIAVAASAHAIDALYGEVVAVAQARGLVLVDPAQAAAWGANKTPRHARIFETLKRAFRFEDGLGHENRVAVQTRPRPGGPSRDALRADDSASARIRHEPGFRSVCGGIGTTRGRGA